MTEKLSKAEQYIYIYIYIYTVEPVYGGHSWDLTKVAAIERWPPYAGHM